MRALLAALAFALTATSALADDQFDLKCTGVQQVGGAKTAPWSDAFSIDLASGSYCRQPCQQVQTLSAVEPGRLVFWDHDGGWPYPGSKTFFAVNRSNGEIDDFIDEGPEGLWRTTGACTVAPFTPMPKTLF